MGKVKKARLHQASLTQQILDSGRPRRLKRTLSPEDLHTAASSAASKGDAGHVGVNLSRKIIEMARQQQDDLEEEVGLGYRSGGGGLKKRKRQQKQITGPRVVGEVKVSLGGKDAGSSSEQDSEEEFDFEGDEDPRDFCPTVNKEDEVALEQFMNKEKEPRLMLADVIMEKIRDKRTEIASQLTDAQSVVPELDEKIVTIFKGVGTILSKYRSGKLPKAFKVIPSLANWEEVLYLTEPDKWSAAAMYQATRIFASNLSAPKAQHFYNLVLLPRVRDDISEYKRLNYHLYMSLKKALFKPAAFFKGILLPLCESGTCTLREALIIGSVLAKTNIPMLHSSAALLRIAEMEYSGANSIFIRTLLDKKYALPYRVIDAIVFHFLGFRSERRTLPVLWHQSLLTFVQRYKEDVSVEQKEALLELLHNQTHHSITAEIRREIVNSKCRDIGVTFVNRNQPFVNQSTAMATD